MRSVEAPIWSIEVFKLFLSKLKCIKASRRPFLDEGSAEKVWTFLEGIVFGQKPMGSRKAMHDCSAENCVDVPAVFSKGMHPIYGGFISRLVLVDDGRGRPLVNLGHDLHANRSAIDRLQMNAKDSSSSSRAWVCNAVDPSSFRGTQMSWSRRPTACTSQCFSLDLLNGHEL